MRTSKLSWFAALAWVVALLVARPAAALPLTLQPLSCHLVEGSSTLPSHAPAWSCPARERPGGRWHWHWHEAKLPPMSPGVLRVSVRQSRFDRVVVVFRYADGEQKHLQAVSGDFGRSWRLGGTLAFNAPDHDAPVEWVSVGFMNADWPHLLHARAESILSDTRTHDEHMIVIGMSLALLILSVLGNILLGLATRRRAPLWHAAWAAGVIGWALMWTQLVLLFAPGLAGTSASRFGTFFSTAAIGCAGGFLLSMTWNRLPRWLKAAAGMASVVVTSLGLAVALASGPVLSLLATALQVSTLLSALLVFAACGTAWRRGSGEARDVLLSFTIPMLAVLWSSLAGSGATESDFSGMYMVLVACSLQTIWLTLMAGWRVSNIRRQRDAALAAEARMTTIAETDVLTGLLNRRGFVQRAQQLLDLQSGAALILLDLDHFKKVNDTFGHDVGDELLRVVGATLKANVRDAVAGRLGGEEFGIMAAVPPGAAALLASRILKAIASIKLPAGDQRVRPTASAGVACGNNEQFNALYRIADQALYAAKAKGRDCMVMAPGLQGAASAEDARVAANA